MAHLWWVYVNRAVSANNITQITDMKDGADITGLVLKSALPINQE